MAVLSCVDEPTGLRNRFVVDQPRLSTVGNEDLGSYSLIPPGDNAMPHRGGNGWQNTGIQIPAHRIVVVHTEGTVTTALNPTALAGWHFTIDPFTQSRIGSFGPRGAPGPSLVMSVQFRPTSGSADLVTPGDGQPAGAPLKQAFISPYAGYLEVNRTGMGGDGVACYSPPGQLGCPPKIQDQDGHVSAPLWVLSGEHTVRAEVLSANLTLEANYHTVTPNKVVTFTAGTDGGFVKRVLRTKYNTIADSLEFPLQVTAWRWVPESGTGQTIACTHIQKVCSTAVKESGTMYVDALVNGETQTKEVKVTVHIGPALLVLEADKSSVELGETVTFTARAMPDTIDGQAVGVSETSWAWEPRPGQPNSECVDQANPCASTIHVSNTLTVTAKVNGQVVAPASASVVVTSAPKVLTLIASKQTVGPGENVTFTGTLTVGSEVVPASEYQVIDWRFEPPNVTAVASQSGPPRGQNSPGVARPSMSAALSNDPADSVWTDPSAVDSLLNVADSIVAVVDGGSGSSGPLPLTEACDASVGMICSVLVNSAGTMHLTVEADGALLEATASVAIPYACPHYAPAPGVSVLPEIVFESAQTYIWVPNPGLVPPAIRINIGSRTVKVWGPWEFVEEYPRGGGWWPLGDYKPSGGIVVSEANPTVMIRPHSTVRFECKTTLSEDGFEGSLIPAGKANIYWLRQQ